MKLGVQIFVTDETPPVPELARAVEERGFESLWVTEHTHIPASRITPFTPDVPIPGGPETIPLPRPYYRTLDPFVTLGAAAAVTTTLKLGTGICLVTQRDPIVTAKEVASLDFLSGGRVLFGVGAGWLREEIADHGTDPKTRFALMRERVEAMKALWTEEEASYDGRFVSFERALQFPKPVQAPHPPIFIGGNGPKVLERVLAYGDGWMPNPSPDDETVIARARELWAQRDDVPVMISGAPVDAARLSRFADAGFMRAGFFVPSAGWDEIEPVLDEIAAAAASL
ncbi:MAG: LLM class F420-dependent oxidoreductase [Solirubrobacteraceae bacterium]|nr:LLM class F420-dependent oxidoreductase [Solirubrobacteraceae bacterium]